MTKLFLTLLILLVSVSWAEDVLHLRAEHTWTIDDAKNEAFQDVVYQINTSNIQTEDPNWVENKVIIARGGGKIGSRQITVFDRGMYAATEEDSSITYYYLSNGKTIKVDIKPPGNNYPKTERSYAIGSYFSGYQDGQLMGVSVSISFTESFDFNPDGTLDTHWSGQNCYHADGSSCGTRQLLKN